MNISLPAAKSFLLDRASGVTALLGPTNTGKTHHAIERMLAHSSGMIGLPLRLLAREVYNRAVAKVGSDAVALITGEEKIKPKSPRYFVSTVEAMPRGLDLAFMAVDEIQLAADLDRGHVFTDRLLHWRGREETLLIGAATMHRAVRQLLPGARIVTRPRLSTLSFAGEKKITRLPRRSAIVAFSAEDVYAIAEWIRRQRGGAAVVLGALSPRTRNAQVAMFQNGDVDYIVATDAIGMGLNLEVDHIAFAADRKFDGWQHRRLTAAEFGQIAGRAGRHLRDGTFGTTGSCAPFEAELVEALEEHDFDPVGMLQWRNTELDFSSIPSLAASLDALPKEKGLTRAPLAEDQMVLELAARDEKVVRVAKTRADIERLWDCCQIPDYRKLSPAAHAELVLAVFGFVVRAGHIPDDWFARHVAALDRIDGGLDALSARIAAVRTWTYTANRSGWLRDPDHWQSVTRAIEDKLSDALHERLAQRFVDRRASVLMRRLRENAMLEAEVTPSGDVLVEGQHVGQLNGFRFTADPEAAGEAAKALNTAALKALASEIDARATRVSEAVDDAFILANDGTIRWLGEPVSKICAGARVLEPRVSILADEQLTGHALALVQRRLDLWLAQHVKKLLGPLADLEKGEGLDGIARGIAFQLAESLGVLERAQVADDVKSLTQDARAALRKFGVRFGAYHLYLPSLVKPAPRALAAQLYALKHGSSTAGDCLDEVLHLAASGRTSLPASKNIQKNLYRAAGFRLCGDRAVRVDILERLADLIRPAVSYRPGITPGKPPPGAADGDGFVVTVAMTSLAGCAGESFASIVRALGYVPEQRKGPAITVPLSGASEALPEPAGEASVSGQDLTPEGGDGESLDAQVDQLPAESRGFAEQKAEADTPAALGPDQAPAAVAFDEQPVPQPAAAEESNSSSPEAMPAEEPLIEVWRPRRQHHHGRKHDSRPRKGHVGQREAAFAAAATETAPGQMGDVTGEVQAGERTAKEGRAGLQTESKPAPLQAHRGGQREGGQRPPSGGQVRGWKPSGEQNRGGMDERKEQRGAYPGAKKKRQSDRPPDPNSPFAKLLVLKARLEEKNKQES
jgi:ATP-dependent RNA helicase SUPV3L1/SUV3